MKKIILVSVIISTILMSCSKGITPNQAANRGGLKCGKYRLK